MTGARFAMDHNFPQPLVKALGSYFAEAELVAIQDIDSRLPELDDWALLLALHQAGGWAGLITCDANILKLPRELAVLLQTKQALVIAEAAGHDPLKATGLLLTHLPSVCKRLSLGTAQLWRLSAVEKRPEDPWSALKRLTGSGTTTELYNANKLTDAELRASPLARRDNGA